MRFCLACFAFLLCYALIIEKDIENKEAMHIAKCEMLAQQLNHTRIAWENAPKLVGYNMKSEAATAHFNAYNTFNTECP